MGLYVVVSELSAHPLAGKSPHYQAARPMLHHSSLARQPFAPQSLLHPRERHRSWECYWDPSPHLPVKPES